MEKRRGILAVVSGFAGTGKGTVIRRLMELHPGYALSVSATSRAPRPGETEGGSYFFKTGEVFEEMIRKGEFLEYARYVGNYYGTPRAFVEEKLLEGINVLLEIEIQGAMQIKKAFPEAVLIFILPPGAGELKQRLVNRGTESEAVIRERLLRAAEEAEFIENYDYVVVNDIIEDCAERVHGIIRTAACTPDRNRELIGRLRQELRTNL